MKYCMSTMCIDSSSLNDKIKAIGSAGFDSIEMSIKDIDGLNLKDIKSRIADAGLVIAEFAKIEGWFEDDHTLMGVNPGHKSIMDECKRRMAMAKDMNAEYIVAVPSRTDRGFYHSFEQGRDHYYELLEIGNEIGIHPTLEFIGQSGQVNTLEAALEFTKSFQCKLVVDAFHLWRSGGDPDDVLKITKEMISMLHISDANNEYPREVYKDRHRVMPGDGIIDLKRFIRNVKGLGFDGHISLGCYNHAYWLMNPYEVAKEGLNKMKRIIE